MNYVTFQLRTGDLPLPFSGLRLLGSKADSEQIYGALLDPPEGALLRLGDVDGTRLKVPLSSLSSAEGSLLGPAL